MAISKLKKLIKNPGIVWIHIRKDLTGRGFFKWRSDEAVIKSVYKREIKKTLHLENPITYNEKLQWLKLHDRKAVYTTMVDKYDAKKYVADIIGEEYIIPTLGVWDRFEDIDFDNLPDQFVLKCTHDSGGLVICKDKNTFNRKAAKRKINACLKRNFFWGFREWPYKNVKPRIIAEKYMEDAETAELRDYKFFTFGGKAKVLMLASERQRGETRFDYFDADFNHLNMQRGNHKNADSLPQKPKCFDLMLELAEKLAEGTTHLRVDFYEANGKVYFGELTFYPGGGFAPFTPEEWDTTLGEWIVLPEKTNK